MSFLKKGPEIKLSEIKVPGPVRDIYYDLKDRHLLPLAAILLIAIVVVPFALGRSSSGEPAGGAAGEGAVTAQSSSAGGKSSELVAKSAPGLRDYRRRLEHLKSKNPFRQQYQGGEPSGEGGSTGGGSSTTTTETTAGEETTYEVEGGGSSGSGSGSSGSGEGTWYSYAIDVRVTTGGAEGDSLGVGGNSLSTDGGTVSAAPLAESGGKGGRKTRVRRNLPELTMLPSREAPALTYMGSTKDGKKALMLISSDVNALFGDARCVIGSSTCQLLALEVGLPETVVYGSNNRSFKIELLEIRLVESKKLQKAPIGKPRKHPEG
jgi:hypothetical protein